MHNLLLKETLALEVKLEEAPKIFLWSCLGPALLLGALVIFLFKSAPSYWPLTLTFFLGYAATCFAKRKGLWFSLISLCCVLIFMPHAGKEVFWTALMGASIAISWVLIYLGSLETASYIASWEDKIKILEEEKLKVGKQLRGSLSEEQRQRAEEKQRLDALICENANLQSRAFEIIRLRDENINLQSRVVELSRICEESSIKKVAEGIETDPEEKFRFEQLQYQFAALREQFDEKSEALNRARRDLFRLENEFLALQITQEEKKYELSPEDAAYLRDLKSQEENCRELELQTIALQDFISALLLPKKRSNSKKTKEPVQELLPGLFRK